MENLTIPEQPPKPTIERLSDGDVYTISCPGEESLKEIITKIAVGFEEPSFLHKEIIATILDNRDWRFEGTFNVKRRGNSLLFDNRNGRGVESNRLKMKEIIDQF